MDAYIATISGINKTIYPEFVRFEQSKQFFHFDLQQNEIIVSMTLEIYAQGNLMQNQSMEIISINDELENNKEYFEYLLYSRSA